MPAEFQRYMKGCLEDLRDECCAPYLDDVIIFSMSLEEHIEHVRKLCQRLKESGIKVKAKECDLFKKEVKYLGQIVSQEGYHADPENTSSLLLVLKRGHQRLLEEYNS